MQPELSLEASKTTFSEIITYPTLPQYLHSYIMMVTAYLNSSVLGFVNVLYLFL